jgi:hypothetical protein
MTSRRVETLEPEDLASLGSMFDETWAAVAAGFDHADEDAKAAARARLARILLELVDQEDGPELIKQTAVRAFLQSQDSLAPAE